MQLFFFSNLKLIMNHLQFQKFRVKIILIVFTYIYKII